jgi:hypothetical protein
VEEKKRNEILEPKMKTVACALVLCVVVLVAVNAQQPRYFQQQLDHFNPLDNRQEQFKKKLFSSVFLG